MMVQAHVDMAHGACPATVESVPPVRAGGSQARVQCPHNGRVVLTHDVPLWFGLARLYPSRAASSVARDRTVG